MGENKPAASAGNLFQALLGSRADTDGAKMRKKTSPRKFFSLQTSEALT
jgi:hypothetical protein